MQGFIKSILRSATAVLAAFAMTSCVYDDLQDETVAPEGSTVLSISLKLPKMSAESRAEGAYEAGVGYENYLDIYNGGFSIYFFGTDNKYITRFVPMLISGPDANRDNEYKVQGLVPGGIAELNEFKIVVLANWPSYPDDSMVPGTTSIDNLCNDASAQFERLSSFDLNPDKGLIIPFYGIHHYTNVTLSKGKVNTLAEPVALLRAMAKVEVVVDIAGVSLSDIGLRGFNAKGFCAPDNVYKHSDYDHNGNWQLDYVKTPHLIGGANDANQGAASLPLFRQYVRDDTHKETWIAYLPEYRNTAADDYKARIEFKLDIQDDAAKPYEIYFADYDANGKMLPDTYQDILRNNCYRFTVSLNGGILILKTEQWENAYDNHFTFE